MRSTAGDPFGERTRARVSARLHVLGGAFTVQSTDAALLDLALDAFGGLPRHRLAPQTRRFHVRLAATDHARTWPDGAEPPRPIFTAGAGLLCATIDAGNFAVVDPAMSRALVGISRALLRHRYHARYELVEFAFVTLASRAQSLVPLHAACVGARGAGLLLMGPSGAGKSTLSLHAAAGGMQLLAEDSAFVIANGLRVTGVPNYLHLQPSATAFLAAGPLLRRIRHSPMIRRRSGVRKYEVDLRGLPARIARAPLRLAASVFLSQRAAGPPLEPVGGNALRSRLRREQPYASGLPGWEDFERQIVALPAYELRREPHPDLAVRHLHALLAAARVEP